MINLEDHNGNQVALDPTKLVKLRTSVLRDEPVGTVLVDYASDGFFARGTIAQISAVFAPYVRLAALHAPDGTSVRLNSDAIAAVAPVPVGSDGKPTYAGNSIANVADGFKNDRVKTRNRIPLKQTVAEAQKAIEDAVIGTFAVARLG